MFDPRSLLDQFLGGVLGLLLGSKSVRKMAGGAIGYGGAAALGAHLDNQLAGA